MPFDPSPDSIARLADRRWLIDLYADHLGSCALCRLQGTALDSDCPIGAALWGAIQIAAAAESPTLLDEPHPEWIAMLLDVDGEATDLLPVAAYPEGAEPSDDDVRRLAQARKIAGRSLRCLQGYAAAIAFLDELAPDPDRDLDDDDDDDTAPGPRLVPAPPQCEAEIGAGGTRAPGHVGPGCGWPGCEHCG